MPPTPTSTTSPDAPAAPTSRRLGLWIGLAVVVALVLLVGGPYAYIHFGSEDAPAPLSLSSGAPTTVAGASPSTTAKASTGSSAASSSASTGSASGIEGTWNVADGSQAGYRVQETLMGQGTEAVGRTTAVTGTVTIAGDELTGADLSVDLTKVKSDKDMRDGQFQGRIMETSQFPTATFVVTTAVPLGTIPADGATTTVSVTGDLTLHGTTKTVTVPIEGQRAGDQLKVSGSIPITFADYGINNPSGGPAQVGDQGTLEFLVVLAQ